MVGIRDLDTDKRRKEQWWESVIWNRQRRMGISGLERERDTGSEVEGERKGTCNGPRYGSLICNRLTANARIS